MPYRDRLVKLSLLPLEYRREMNDLVLSICNARAGHIDLGQQYFFFQIVVRPTTSISSDRIKLPNTTRKTKLNYLKHRYRSTAIFGTNYQRVLKAWTHFILLKEAFRFHNDKTVSYNLSSSDGVS